MNPIAFHVLILGLLLPLFFGCTAKPINTAPGVLPPCPDSPNCVSSLSEDPKNSVAPLIFEGSVTDAQDRLTTLLKQMPDCTITDIQPLYVRAEYRSRIFKFVDDVMFLFDEKQAVIHLRSAARTGYYDFGVNRKRVETIRRLWQKKDE